DEALAVLRECLAQRLQKDAEDWWVSQTKSQLGQALTGLKRYVEAEGLLREAHEGLTARRDKIPGRFHRVLAESARAMADLHEAGAKKDQQATWRERKDGRPRPATSQPSDLAAPARRGPCPPLALRFGAGEA